MRLAISLRLAYLWREKLSMQLAAWMPRHIVMWCYYRVLTELDPDDGTRKQRPVDVVGRWAEYHGLNGRRHG